MGNGVYVVRALRGRYMRCEAFLAIGRFKGFQKAGSRPAIAYFLNLSDRTTVQLPDNRVE